VVDLQFIPVCIDTKVLYAAQRQFNLAQPSNQSSETIFTPLYIVLSTKPELKQQVNNNKSAWRGSTSFPKNLDNSGNAFSCCSIVSETT
jgi:hypothetical protein